MAKGLVRRFQLSERADLDYLDGELSRALEPWRKRYIDEKEGARKNELAHLFRRLDLDDFVAAFNQVGVTCIHLLALSLLSYQTLALYSALRDFVAAFNQVGAITCSRFCQSSHSLFIALFSFVPYQVGAITCSRFCQSLLALPL
jgi:hypothetical protein